MYLINKGETMKRLITISLFCLYILTVVVIFVPTLKTSVSYWGIVAPSLGIAQILYSNLSGIYRFVHKLINYFSGASFNWVYTLNFNVDINEHQSQETIRSAVEKKIFVNQSENSNVIFSNDHSIRFETQEQFTLNYKIVLEEDISEDFTNVNVAISDRGSFSGMKSSWVTFVKNAAIIQNSFESPTQSEYSATLSARNRKVEYLVESPAFGNVSKTTTSFETKRSEATGHVLLQHNSMAVSSKDEIFVGKILSEVTIKKQKS